MRDFVVARAAAVAKKADVGDVMLAAGVKAAADFDLQVFDRLGKRGVLRAETTSQFSGQAP
jgi:hypothetical protein